MVIAATCLALELLVRCRDNYILANKCMEKTCIETISISTNTHSDPIPFFYTVLTILHWASTISTIIFTGQFRWLSVLVIEKHSVEWGLFTVFYLYSRLYLQYTPMWAGTLSSQIRCDWTHLYLSDFILY